jgi:hypothetical protein
MAESGNRAGWLTRQGSRRETQTARRRTRRTPSNGKHSDHATHQNPLAQLRDGHWLNYATVDNEQARNLHTLVDRRSGTASTVFCTQLPPDQWHDRMEEKIVADAIIDRIVNNSHMTVLDCGESMRKHFNQMAP